VSRKRLRVLTWHVHGNYLHYLTQAPHDFYVVTDARRSAGYSGLGGLLPWGENAREAPLEKLHQLQFDCVLYQSRRNYKVDRLEQLSDAQRGLPGVFLEHDPPQEHPTNTRHFVDDPHILLVHVTHFNRLMWDSGRSPNTVIEHGVLLPQLAHFNGDIERGVVVVNHLAKRGRRLGADVFEDVRRQLPLDLIGMDSERLGGLGEIANVDLAPTMARYRFFFHPIRYTSLGLAVVEAMMVGLPIVALATTEMVTVIRDGESGYIHTDPQRLVERMRGLLDNPGEARALGLAARRAALERFNIGRFAVDWDRALREVCS
jgi:glycosyltransferase involved in cell wall biosynthesis